ncbi:MAG TPA: hypothetical protein VH878_02505 [Thermodesulfobacteriota bacterium]
MKRRYEILYDVRVIDRDIREGIITKKTYEEHLKKIPDISDKGCPLVIDDEETKETSEITHGKAGEDE